jgi:CubicO group peptidase (beta-lactamase class C family)
MSTTVDAPVFGVCEARFEKVRAAFVENLRALDLGAGVSVWIDGTPVVDLWGGWTGETRQRPWAADTLCFYASSTKPFLGVALMQLVERGLAELDAPVSRYWPGFVGGGKDAVTVRHLLSHRGGLPGISADYAYETQFDWGAMVRLLEAQAVFWPPGEAHGYHPVTYMFLVGETIRRVSGQTPGDYLRQHVAGPLGLDMHLGVAEADLARIADASPVPPGLIAPSPGYAELMARAAEPGSIAYYAFARPPAPPDAANLTAMRLSQITAHGTARALGRFYAALAGGALDGVQLLAPETLALARAEQGYGPDMTLGHASRFGLGFMLRHEGFAIGPSPNAFGHSGAGGSLGFADPDRRLAFGYVMNRVKPSGGGSVTAHALVAALYDSL